MVKKIDLITAGIVTSTMILSGHKPQKDIDNASSSTPDKSHFKKEITINSSASNNTNLSSNIITAQKRTPTKVYHRFEEIPEITDFEANLYSPNEYTYIINADNYQKTGDLELKRVLKQEVTKANTLSLIYRSECQSYTPKPKEDQLACYTIDLKLINQNGKYKGPSQMDDQAITNFIKYLASSPKYSQYVTPIIKNSPKELFDLQKKFFNPDGSARSQESREMLQSTNVYKNIKINTAKWADIASLELKNYINQKERSKSLSNITKTYFCLTELFPDNDTMVKALEEYNLSCFPLNRQGKPKHVLSALALSLNLIDQNGNLDATRIPTYVVSATLSHINWQGNGRKALKDAQALRHSKTQVTPEKLKSVASQWVTGKSKTYGIDEISQLNIITEDIVNQYVEIEMPGAKNLAQKYANAVKQKEEAKFQQLADNNLTNNSSTTQNEKSSSQNFFLSLKDFILQR